MIPARIHQIWMNGDVPGRLATPAASWRTLHPDWEYRLWTAASLDEFVHAEYPKVWGLYRDYPEWIQRVDAARYMLLHHFGGVYADFDVECVRSLDPLRHHSVVLPATAPLGLSNDLMMSVPRHAVFATVIDRLARSRARWGHWYVPRHFRVLLTTGSLHLTMSVARSPDLDDVYVLPPELYSSQDRSRAYVYHWPGDGWAGWDTRLFAGLYAASRRVVRVAVRIPRATGSASRMP
jgi:mannosyltransferase OCH1-like enzyme